MYSDFKTALDAYLVANWPWTPILDFANLSGIPTGYVSWMGYKPKFMSDEGYARSDGTDCILATYGMEFSIFIGAAQGQAEAIDLSEKLKTLFIGKRLNSNMVFMAIDTEFGVNDENESSGKWYETRVFVTVEHRYHI